ncbi:hypothetical protein MOVI109754_14045 [Moritella viscosa]
MFAFSKHIISKLRYILSLFFSPNESAKSNIIFMTI